MAFSDLKTFPEIPLRGAYGGTYRYHFVPYAESPKTHSTVCFVFAGQGAAFPGMFSHLYHRFETVRKTFEKGDAQATRLGLPLLTAYVLEHRRLTEDQQLSVQNLVLFTGSLAIHELLLEAKVFPRAITAHSFGEYAAIVAGGMMGFEEMFEWVAFREASSPPRNERGYLVAVSGNESFTQQLIKGLPCSIANLNSPSQTVVAVPAHKLQTLTQHLAKHSVRHKVLPTPQPYHSPLLAEIPPLMRARLKHSPPRLSRFHTPVYSSVRHAWIENPPADVPFILENQTIERVDFIDQVRSVARYGCDHFIEIGPASVLCPFVEAISELPKQRILLADDYFEDFQKTTAIKPDQRAQPNKVLDAINKVISSVTGYRIEEISLEDKFQEDLGIDSIKKTEILFSVFDEMRKEGRGGINTAGIQKVGDLLHAVENAQDPSPLIPAHTLPPRFERYQKVWSESPLLADEPSQLPTLFIDIDFAQARPLDRSTWRKLRRLSKEGKFNCVLLYPQSPIDWDFLSPHAFPKVLEGKIIPLVKVMQKFVLTHQDAFEGTLALVTQGKRDPLAEGFGAFLKSLRKENPRSAFKALHFDTPPSPESLRTLILRELQDIGSPEVLYSKGHRFLPSLERIEEETKLNTQGPPRVVVAIGGAKGITRSLLHSLSQKIPLKLYVLGRSPEPEVRNSLEGLETQVKELSYFNCDASDFSKLEQSIHRILREEKRIDYIFNGAGIESSQVLSQKNKFEIRKELTSKMLPAFNLTCLCRSLPHARLIHFSSIVSEFGNPGQTVYAWANQFINTLSEICELNAVSIAWPPWDGVGMTAPLAIHQGLRRLGVGLLSEEKAAELFTQDMAFGQEKARTIYYYDPADYPAFGMSLRKLATHTPALGTPHGVAGKVAFSRIYSAQSDSFLMDHKLGGRAYLPGAVGASQFLAIGRAALGYFPRLEALRFDQPLLIPDRKTAVAVVWDPRTKIAEMGMGTPAFSAKLLSPGPRPSRMQLPAGSQEIHAGALYAKEALFHGPSFQVIDKIFRHGSDFLRVKLKRVPAILDQALHGSLAQAIDGAFQAVALFPLLDKRGLHLPVEVDLIDVFVRLSQYQAEEILVACTRRSEKGIEADVQVIGSAGEVIISLSGVRCQAAAFSNRVNEEQA